jgi:phosphoenolpyruvate synthase/pyruvate phosphate dikinase
MSKNKEDQFILWFDELRIGDVPLVGGKNASLIDIFSGKLELKMQLRKRCLA